MKLLDAVTKSQYKVVQKDGYLAVREKKPWDVIWLTVDTCQTLEEAMQIIEKDKQTKKETVVYEE